MYEKHNDATRNRPEGPRIIDAPSVVIDLPTFIQQIKNEEAWSKSDRNSITVFKSDDLRIVLGALHKDAEMIPHKAEGMMSIQVLDGILDVTTDEQDATLRKGQMIAIHKGHNYRVVASEESIYLLTMSGVRSDGKMA
jgi:quercetin dioxygenase-like cupin family protein